jgi:chaperonin cofactor prefoldin
MSASAATKKKGQQPDEQEVLQVQQQAEDLQRQLNALNANLASNQNTLRKSKLTLKELDLLPESTPVYKAIGRM